MKKLFYLFAVLFISATTLMAQPPQRDKGSKFSPETRAMMRVDILTQTVTLSEKERAEVLALFTKEEEQRASQKAERNADREAAKKACEKQREKDNAALKGIIGNEKFEAYEAVCKQKQDSTRQKQGEKKGPNKKK